MSGETEQAPSAWTIDSLHSNLGDIIEANDARYEQRFADHGTAISAALASTDLAVSRAFAAVETLQKEIDRRYEQRFVAQETAMSAALAAAEKAVAAALAAAEKAVIKAEVAADKRFDSVNEFRGQLADQAATFMPRTETALALLALTEKVDLAAAKLDKLEGNAVGINVVKQLEEIRRQIDANTGNILSGQGETRGGAMQVVERRQSQAALYAAVGIAITVLTFLIGIAGYAAGRP